MIRASCLSTTLSPTGTACTRSGITTDLSRTLSQEYAHDGQRPIPEHDIVDAICTVVLNSGIFSYDCSRWDDRSTPTKTRANFTQHCNAVQLKTHRRSKAIAKMGGFRGANSIHEYHKDQLNQAKSALSNMVNTAAEDRGQMNIKDGIIADQVHLIATLTQQLSAAQARISVLQSMRPPAQATLRSNSPTCFHNPAAMHF